MLERMQREVAERMAYLKRFRYSSGEGSSSTTMACPATWARTIDHLAPTMLATCQGSTKGGS